MPFLRLQDGSAADGPEWVAGNQGTARTLACYLCRARLRSVSLSDLAMPSCSFGALVRSLSCARAGVSAHSVNAIGPQGCYLAADLFFIAPASWTFLS